MQHGCKLNTANIALIGYGARGKTLLPVLLDMNDVHVAAVCDSYPDRAKDAALAVEHVYGEACPSFTNYKLLLAQKDIDGVIISTSWYAHCRIAIDAMKAGKYVAIECGGGSSLDELWELVKVGEETGIPCMALENCCYDRNEMAVLNMIKQGLFGEIVHVEGGYGHDLRDEITHGHENRHYRFDNYRYRNAELYPGHAIGPISKYININRGNRMISLVSMASKARGLKSFIIDERGPDSDYAQVSWNEGDIVQTLIRCAGGETILLTHDTSLPRYYSRFGKVQGTKGLWQEEGNYVFFEGQCSGESWEHKPFDFAPLYEQYKHPLWKQFEREGVRGGHGGMDWLVLRAFVESILNGTECPTDVYDAASWMAVTVLSEISIAQGSTPVYFPDFTNGKWINRQPFVRSRYCLDEVCRDLYAAEDQ